MNIKTNFILLTSYLLLAGCSTGFLGLSTSSDKKDYLRAKQLYNQGQYKQAIQELSQYVYKTNNVKRREARLYLLLGKSYEALNNPGKAIEIYTEALDFHPNNIPLLLASANLYQKTQLTTKSISTYDTVLKLEPKSTEALLGQAINFTTLGFYAKAQSFYQDLFKNSTHIEPSWLAGYAENFLAQHQPDQALIYSVQAIEKDNKNASFWFIQARALYELEKLEEALEALEIAISLDPTNETFLFSKALWLYDVGEFSNSLQIAQQLKSTNPQSELALFIEFLNLKHLGQTNKANTIFKKLSQINSNSFIQKVLPHATQSSWFFN